MCTPEGVSGRFEIQIPNRTVVFEDITDSAVPSAGHHEILINFIANPSSMLGEVDLIMAAGRTLLVKVKDSTYRLSGGFNANMAIFSSNVRVSNGGVILPPSSKNWAIANSGVVTSQTIEDGKFHAVVRKYVPTGAYTEEAARHKVGLTLMAQRGVRQAIEEFDFLPMQTPEAAFLYYFPDNTDQYGNPLYGIAFKEPSSDVRFDSQLSILMRSLALYDLSGDEASAKDTLQRSIARLQVGGLRIARAAGFIHNVLGLYHRQLTFGNTGETKGVPYIADWESPLPLSQNWYDRRLQIALDLTQTFMSGMRFIDFLIKNSATFEKLHKVDSVGFISAWGLLNNIINGYNITYARAGLRAIEIKLNELDNILGAIETGDGINSCVVMDTLLNQYLVGYRARNTVGPTTLGLHQCC